ncbi:MAG: hypothetical protein AAF985_16845, partial [Bacteroidota bacterium]
MTDFKNGLIKGCFGIFLLLGVSACSDTLSDETFDNSEIVLLLIDEDGIDNNAQPNDFSAEEVNDQLAAIGLRNELTYFKDHPGELLDLYSGQVGDEGWFAIKTIPTSWQNTGPTNNGTLNFLTPGPGLGSSSDTNNDPEALLTDIADVTPLRATGLTMLKGKTVIAVVYDDDLSINYAPLSG